MHSVKSSDGSCVFPLHTTGFIFCRTETIDTFSCLVTYQVNRVDKKTHCKDTKVRQVIASAGDNPLTSASEWTALTGPASSPLNSHNESLMNMLKETIVTTSVLLLFLLCTHKLNGQVMNELYNSRLTKLALPSASKSQYMQRGTSKFCRAVNNSGQGYQQC